MCVINPNHFQMRERHAKLGVYRRLRDYTDAAE